MKVGLFVNTQFPEAGSLFPVRVQSFDVLAS